MSLLQEESKLMEIVKLIGSDILPDNQKLILEISRLLRLGFLQQNAFHDVDTYVPLDKQKEMMAIYLYLYHKATEVIELGIPVSQIRKTGIFDELIKIKYTIGNESLEAFKPLYEKIDKVFGAVMDSYKNFERVRS